LEWKGEKRKAQSSIQEGTNLLLTAGRGRGDEPIQEEEAEIQGKKLKIKKGISPSSKKSERKKGANRPKGRGKDRGTTLARNGQSTAKEGGVEKEGLTSRRRKGEGKKKSSSRLEVPPFFIASKKKKTGRRGRRKVLVKSRGREKKTLRNPGQGGKKRKQSTKITRIFVCKDTRLLLGGGGRPTPKKAEERKKRNQLTEDLPRAVFGKGGETCRGEDSGTSGKGKKKKKNAFPATQEIYPNVAERKGEWWYCKREGQRG